MSDIAGAILVLGLAGISVYAYKTSGGEIGEGWGLLAFLVLVMWAWGR